MQPPRAPLPSSLGCARAGPAACSAACSFAFPLQHFCAKTWRRQTQRGWPGNRLLLKGLQSGRMRRASLPLTLFNLLSVLCRQPSHIGLSLRLWQEDLFEEEEGDEVSRGSAGCFPSLQCWLRRSDIRPASVAPTEQSSSSRLSSLAMPEEFGKAKAKRRSSGTIPEEGPAPSNADEIREDARVGVQGASSQQPPLSQQPGMVESVIPGGDTAGGGGGVMRKSGERSRDEGGASGHSSSPSALAEDRLL